MRTAWSAVVLGAGMAIAMAVATVSANAFERCSGQSDEPLVKLLPPPACDTCEVTKAELDELAEIAKTASDERKKRARDDVAISVEEFLRGTDIPFDDAKLKACEGSLFKTLRKDGKPVIDAAKDTFCRTRPFNNPANPVHTDPAGLAASNDSYPSGHSAYGAAIGMLLAAMLPEKRAAIYARIEDYAYSRLVLGVHFPSDVEGGKLIGTAFAASLLARPGFQKQFDETKACIRNAVGFE